MVHTWQSDHRKKLEIANLEGGDVVVCGAFAAQAEILPELDEGRVCFVAPLGSRSDLEWLLRGLHLHPGVRHLVVCGDDLSVTAEALLALWQDGLDPDGEISGSRGRLGEGIDAAAVDALRKDVVIRDWRGRSASVLAEGVRELPVLPREREPHPLPDPGIPRRKVFLSRKTSFPIFSSDAGDSWLQLLNLTLRIGTEKLSRAGERVAEALNAVVTIGLPVVAEDLEAEEIPEIEVFPSILDFNSDDFERYYRRFEAPASQGDASEHRDYGERLRAWGEIDQLEAACERLSGSADTPDATMVVLQPEDLHTPALAPNLISATFNVVEETLYGSFVLRSADVYTDWPLEALALIRLQQGVAERIGLPAGAATFIIHSVRLHERDWARAEERLKDAFKRPLPLQVDHSGVFLFGNDGGQARAMLLDHDAGTIFWEQAFSDAQELSWYIVDAMPWLLPQHFRYVGQECATLMRAMQESECYLQG